MTLRLLETTHGNYFVCCATPFHGQQCPDCKKVYDDPMAEIAGAQEQDSAQGIEAGMPYVPPTDSQDEPTTDPTPAPSVDNPPTTAEDTTEITEAKPKRQRQPKP